MKKHNIPGMICAVFFLITASHAAAAEQPVWTEGNLVIREHDVRVHALVEDSMPDQLYQVQMTGSRIAKKDFWQALQNHFALHPEMTLQNVEAISNWYISVQAGNGGSVPTLALEANQIEIQKLCPITDLALLRIYDACVSCLEALGISSAPNGFILRQDKTYWGTTSRAASGNSEYYTSVLIPYLIEGVSTEYRFHIVNRDRMKQTRKSGEQIMDAPYACFLFDDQDRLVKAEISTLKVDTVKDAGQEHISWTEAAGNALAAVLDDRIEERRNLHGDPNYNEECFWQEERVEISRVVPMWMPNRASFCTPGWCIQFQFYDGDTGEYRYGTIKCVNAVTGEVNSFGYGHIEFP